MDAPGSVGRLRLAAELLFLHRLPPVLRVGVPLVLGAGAAALGVWSLSVQHRFAAQSGGGRVAGLLAHGSSPVTAWEGWAAAAFFLVALVRLRRGAPEPPAGRTPVEELTLAQLRAGLLREYTAVRAGLVVLGTVSLIDLARASRYVVAAATGDSLARSSVVATVIEACGLVVAAVVLALWVATFREQLERVGAIP